MSDTIFYAACGFLILLVLVFRISTHTKATWSQSKIVELIFEFLLVCYCALEVAASLTFR